MTLERTTTIDPGTTLGDLVTAHPDLAAELERRGLDYCCGGARTLAEASAAAGLDAGAVARELTVALDRLPGTGGEPPAWATLDPEALCDHLEMTHHTYLRAEMPRLAALLQRIVGVHGERHPELARVAAVFDELRADLEPHLLKEERVLFPAIRALAAGDRPAVPGGTVRNPIAVMALEHDTVGALLAQLDGLTAGYRPPVDACASYTAAYDGLAALASDTHLHVHKENNLLFPQAIRLEAAAAEPGAG